MSSDRIGFSDSISARVRRKAAEQELVCIRGIWRFVCRDPNGQLKWIDEGDNLVVNTGLSYILGTAILDSATLYIGLTNASPTPAAGDTMATHAGWTEAAGYDEATRVAWGQDAEASQAVSNSTAATFTMDGTDTSIGGGFLSTDNTKDGTAGTLISVKAFTGGNKTVADNDTLDVTLTITGSSS